MYDINDSILNFHEFNSAEQLYEDPPKEFKPIEGSWAWMAKYRVPYRPGSHGFDGIYYNNITHMGIYSPTGSGKTFLHNMLIEVSLWAHNTNIIISDRKFDSLGFLLPQDGSMMTNGDFFPNPRTGTFPIKPDRLPYNRFHVWLPATNFSYVDPLIRELMEWGVVKWFRFHPRIFVETTLGDHLPRAVGMTGIETLATNRAMMDARGRCNTEKQKESWNLNELKKQMEEQKQLTHMSKPHEKLMILEDSGIISTEPTVELIDKTTGEHLQQDVHFFRNANEIVNNPVTQSKHDKTTHLHAFCNRYMSSSTADNTLSTCINYILFSLIKDAAENIPKKPRILCHLPEAEFSLCKTSSQSQNSRIQGYFSDSYADALRETRQWNLFHVLDTQQVTELPHKIPANQLTLWLMPGFKHKAELAWLQAGIGRAQLNNYSWSELFSMKNPFNSRGKAFHIGPEQAVKVWTRPRQTYHFKEGNNPTELLKHCRLTFGIDTAEPWMRWDE